MSDLKRLDEAIDRFYEGIEGYDDRVAVVDAAYAYRALLANGQRVEPDYEAALESLRTMFYPNEYGEGYALEAVTLAVDVAIGNRLLIDPTTEEK